MIYLRTNRTNRTIQHLPEMKENDTSLGQRCREASAQPPAVLWRLSALYHPLALAVRCTSPRPKSNKICGTLQHTFNVYIMVVRRREEIWAEMLKQIVESQRAKTAPSPIISIDPTRQPLVKS